MLSDEYGVYWILHKRGSRDRCNTEFICLYPPHFPPFPNSNRSSPTLSAETISKLLDPSAARCGTDLKAESWRFDGTGAGDSLVGDPVEIRGGDDG